MSEFTNFSLEGKVALVTGASYGIGFAIASAYAECGAHHRTDVDNLAVALLNHGRNDGLGYDEGAVQIDVDDLPELGRRPDGSRHPFDQFICAKTPANRWLKPEELTGPAVFLASEASNAVNGHILYVDGGILAYIGKQPQ